ncbi:MAG: Gfo/Idh/MocA family oxidoreductase [Gemmataceae bacterium]|nr:Gfo/Idh/MocA family oxidoreductase [Gemmataceae bacterium]
MASKSPLDRRKFLGSAAALSLSATGYGQVAGTADRVRVAFVGCGGRAQAHLDLVNRFAKDGKPVAAVGVCDVWDGRDDEYETAFGGKTTRRRYGQGLYPAARKCGLDPADKARVTKDYRRLLDRPDVDAVVVSTPDHWHGKMTADALAAGKDVFVETPLARTAEEAVAVLDAWKKAGRVVTVGCQGMADPVWVAAFDRIRTGGIGHVAHAQTGVFRNDLRGQWRFLRLTPDMTPATVDWDLFLGHGFTFAGRPVGPSPAEQPFDRAAFAQWRCLRAFSGGPFADPLVRNVTQMTAALGVRFPARVTAGGGLYLEYDGRDVPDVGTVVADYDEGCQLVATASTITGYPVEEVIRGRLGAVKFVKGGFHLFRDDPGRGASFGPRLERSPEPNEVVAVEPPRNETEALWENFLGCVRDRRPGTFSPPDLGAAAVAVAALAEQSYRTGRAWYWDKDRRAVAASDAAWAERWEKRSAARGKPGQVFGWSGGDAGSVVEGPDWQRFAGRWTAGNAPGG